MRCAIGAAALVVVLATSARAAEEAATLRVDTGRVLGTLLVPDGPGPSPVVLLIAGSGPTDRDGNNPLIPGKNDSLKLLSQGLLSRGIGSLRYDKRGIAQSAPAAPPEEQLRFETYVHDAIAWGRNLRNDPRFSSLSIVGHSEGALIGSVAARRLPADAFVSLEGAGRAAPFLIRDQLRPQLPPEPMAQSESLLAELQAGRTSAAVPRGLEALFRPSVQPYLISWFRYDPAQEIAKLRIPVLIIHGSADAQVPFEHARILHRANPSARMMIVPGMNHVLKAVAPSDQAKQAASLSDPTLPVVPQVFDELAALVRSLSGATSRQ